MNKKKVFISQPMNGFTDAEILITRKFIISEIEKMLGNNIEIINTYIEDEIKDCNIPLKYLGISIELLADANAAYFADGWENNRGCIIEHLCCEKYGVDIIRD